MHLKVLNGYSDFQIQHMAGRIIIYYGDTAWKNEWDKGEKVCKCTWF